MRRFYVWAPALAFAVVTAAVLAEDNETSDDSMPRAMVVTFHADNLKTGPALQKQAAGLLAKYADKDVLFVTVNLTSRGSRHQAKLLLNTLGQSELWSKYARNPGRSVVLDANRGEVVLAFDGSAKAETVTSVIDKILAPPMDEDACGCEDGCGDDDDGGGDDDGGCDGG